MEMREFEIRNRKGKRMPATLRMPEGSPKGTAIVVHGLAGWKDQPTVVAIADALTTFGYITLAFDASDGLKGPDKSYWSSTTTGHLHDTEDVIEYAKQQDWCGSPLVLAGHSLGGLISLTYAKYHKNVVSKLLLIAPSITWHKDNGRAFVKKMKFIADPDSEKAFVPLYPPWILDFLQYDARKCAPHVDAHTLIVSGENDVLVAPSNEHEKLAHLFPHGTHKIVSGASHTFRGREKELAATISSWLTSS